VGGTVSAVKGGTVSAVKKNRESAMLGNEKANTTKREIAQTPAPLKGFIEGGGTVSAVENRSLSMCFRGGGPFQRGKLLIPTPPGGNYFYAQSTQHRKSEDLTMQSYANRRSGRWDH
jgi:hypothetical protein